MQLGIVLSTVTDAAPLELVELGQLAEAHGYAAVLVNEGRGDALAMAQAIAARTSRITVGTNIANIYFRHPYLAAATARTIAELAGGRLMLGLGMSHRAMLARLGIDMGDARAQLRHYIGYVQNALAGRAGEDFLTPPPHAMRCRSTSPAIPSRVPPSPAHSATVSCPSSRRSVTSPPCSTRLARPASTCRCWR